MPSSPSPLTPLSQDEFEALGQWLLSDAMPESCMDVVTLEGFLTAIAIGPVALSPATWLPRIWGGGEDGPAPQLDSLEAFNDLLSLIMRLYNDIVSTFEADPHAFTPTFYERTVRGKTYTIVDEWCDGFLRGIELARAAWQPMFEESPEMLRPLTLFGTPEGWAELEASEDEEAMHAQWSSKIAPAVRAINGHWLLYRETSSKAPFISKTKVGRNARCPCGSGKKYKRCCGAPRALH